MIYVYKICEFKTRKCHSNFVNISPCFIKMYAYMATLQYIQYNVLCVKENVPIVAKVFAVVASDEIINKVHMAILFSFIISCFHYLFGIIHFETICRFQNQQKISYLLFFVHSFLTSKIF